MDMSYLRGFCFVLKKLPHQLHVKIRSRNPQAGEGDFADHLVGDPAADKLICIVWRTYKIGAAN